MRCRGGSVCQPAVVRVALSDGCMAYPDDREQDLCCQHMSSIEPLGTLEVVAVYEPEVLAWYCRTQGIPVPVVGGSPVEEGGES